MHGSKAGIGKGNARIKGRERHVLSRRDFAGLKTTPLQGSRCQPNPFFTQRIRHRIGAG